MRGEALSPVVIDKIPFCAATIRSRRRIEQMKREGRNAFIEYQLRAVINVKQGAGRRSATRTTRARRRSRDPRLIAS